MGETARDRFHRLKRERAAYQGEATGQLHPVQRAVEGAPFTRAAFQKAITDKRKADLIARLERLGVAVHLNELPDAADELAGMEKFAAECEAEVAAK